MTMRIGSLAMDERGASIVEMGLAAPILATFLIGMMDLSSAYSAKLHLEQAAQRTIEKVQVSSFNEATDKPVLKTEAETAAGAGATATVTAWLECNNDGAKLSYSSSCADSTVPFARYVNVRITRSYKPMFGITWGAKPDGTYTLVGEAGIRAQ